MPVISSANFQTQLSKTVMRSDYNSRSKGQRQILILGEKYIDLAIQAHEFSGNSTSHVLTIADYGASAGANSSAALGMIIEKLRQKYGSDRTKSIIAVHNDLPDNNWGGLFNFLNGDEDSYLLKPTTRQGVFALGCGKSFYNQILPEQSLHFGFSCVSIHWMSQLPCKIKNHCLPNRGSAEELEMCQKQGAEDWENFLAARSKELAKGGVLALHVLSTDECGFPLMMDSCYAALRQFCENGIVTEAEVVNFNLPVILRRIEDVTNTEQLKRLGLELVKGEVCESQPSDYYKLFMYCRDLTTWASAACHALMAVIEPLLRQALASERSDEDKKQICSKFPSAFIEQIKKIEPSQFGESTGNVYVVLKKVM